MPAPSWKSAGIVFASCSISPTAPGTVIVTSRARTPPSISASTTLRSLSGSFNLMTATTPEVGGEAGEQLAGVYDIHRAKAQAFVDVGFLAERARWEDLDLVAAVGALANFLCSPHRGRVIRLADLIDVRKLELGLRVCSAERSQR